MTANVPFAILFATLQRYIVQTEIIGFILSYVLIIAVILVATILRRITGLSPQQTRKVVHLGVSTWWFLAMYFFDTPFWPALGAISFIILNFISHRYSLIKAMDDLTDHDNYGTVYFPVTLLILSFLCFDGPLPEYAGAVAIIALGFGDGLAAMTGIAFGKVPLPFGKSSKTTEGSLAMLMATFTGISLLLYFHGFGPMSLAIAISLASIAALIEAYTPFGLDNLTVPLGVLGLFAYMQTHPNAVLLSFLTALGSNILLGLLAWWRGSVDRSGFLAGVTAGTLIFFFGGIGAWILLGAFFVSSSILSKIGSQGKDSLINLHEKGSTRDYIQVAANSLPALLMIWIYYGTGDPIWFVAFAAAMAASNADTWASELGVLSSRAPVSILTLKPVEKGTSGGVSSMGFLASLAGGLFIAFFAYPVILHIHPAVDATTFIGIITLAGFSGSLADSLLGATIQAQYYCTVTERLTEKPFSNGQETRLVRGFRVINNDMVNLLASFSASLSAIALLSIIIL